MRYQAKLQPENDKNRNFTNQAPGISAIGGHRYSSEAEAIEVGGVDVATNPGDLIGRADMTGNTTVAERFHAFIRDLPCIVLTWAVTIPLVTLVVAVLSAGASWSAFFATLLPTAWIGLKVISALYAFLIALQLLHVITGCELSSGTDCESYFSTPVVVNPSTGSPMCGGIGSIDASGHIYGG